jgi:VWFA-related protein
MRAKLVVTLSCVCVLATIVLAAQDIPPDEIFWGSRPYAPEIANAPAIRVQSDLVEVATVVRDSHEKPVGNLKKEDFLLSDNGKPQTISSFSILTGSGGSTGSPTQSASGASPTVEPRYVAMFFDDLNGGMGNLTFAREAAIKFIQKGLDPGERVGIFTASGALSLDFTDETQRLLETLAKLRIFQRPPNQGAGSCPPLDTYPAWVIVHIPGQTDELRNAIRAARICCGPEAAQSCAVNAAQSLVRTAEDYSLDTLHSITFVIGRLEKMRGRRVLLFASSGFLTLSLAQEQQKVVEAALRANVVINTLDTAGVVFASASKFYMRTPMSQMAEGTGGTFIHNNNDLAGGMYTLSTQPAVSYLLGFSPTNLKVDGSEHKLKVKLAEPNHYSVSARPGYYAPSAELSPSEKRFHKLQENVMASDDHTEIPIQFAVTPETSAGGGSSLKILVHVDVRKLQFQELGGRKAERLIFITALFDEKNQFLTGVQGVMDLRLKEPTLKQITTQGLDAKLSISAPAGSYRVRQVVQESVGGKLAAMNRTVEIR